MAPMEYNIWHAPTDNDRLIKNEWYRASYQGIFETEVRNCMRIISDRRRQDFFVPDIPIYGAVFGLPTDRDRIEQKRVGFQKRPGRFRK